MASFRAPLPPAAFRTMSLFSKEASNLLSRSSLQASPCPWTSGREHEATPGELEEERGVEVGVHSQEGKGDPHCLACQVSFGSRQEQVEHYGLDWHRYNIKRRLKGLESVDQVLFERLEGMRF